MPEVESVLLQWPGLAARTVAVAGQFSNWEPLTMARPEGECWEVR